MSILSHGNGRIGPRHESGPERCVNTAGPSTKTRVEVPAVANEPTPVPEWDVDSLTKLFLSNGAGRIIYRREGRLFDVAPCPAPTQTWHPAKPDGDCMLFVGGSNLPYGHRRISFGGRLRLVHAISFELAVGPIPVGLDLAHRCVGHTACAHPNHVRPETRRVNGREGGLRAWPDAILALGPHETCPKCDAVATTTIQIRRNAKRLNYWALICPVHAAEYVRSKHRGDQAWAGKWYRPMPAHVQSIVNEHVALRGAV